MLKFAGGGIYSAGRLGVDANGNFWVANNCNDIDAVGDADPARPTST